MRHRMHGLLLLLAFAAAFSGVTARRVKASSGSPSHDTWSRHSDKLATTSTATSSTAIVAAVTNKVINVRAITLSSSSAGVVIVTDGLAGPTIGNFYVAANVPVTIYEGLFGPGMKTSSGNGLFAGSLTATVTTFVRYRLE